MTNTIVGLLFGLVIGIYFTACYPEVAIRGIQKIGVPMIGQTVQPVKPVH